MKEIHKKRRSFYSGLRTNFTSLPGKAVAILDRRPFPEITLRAMIRSINHA